ncbi:MAG: TPR end-of-group domain-containing protein [Myxococcaceae bacterium]
MPKPLKKSVFGVSALCAFTALAASATPTISGQYRGELGALLFQTEGDRVSAFYEAGGACELEAGRRIIEGQLEGNVVVGTVTLCQVGSECKERSLPFAAFYNLNDKTLSGQVKLPAGCSSPALRNGRLLLTSTTEKPPAQVRRKLNLKRNAELARQALASGHRLLEGHRYEEAAQQFEVGLSYDDRNWLAYLGLGVSEMRRGNVHKAMGALERSRDLARVLKQDDASIYYNIACGHSRLGNKEAALSSLAMAVKRGFALPEAMTADPDLKPLAEDGEFTRLVNEATEQKNQTVRRGDGNP